MKKTLCVCCVWCICCSCLLALAGCDFERGSYVFYDGLTMQLYDESDYCIEETFDNPEYKQGYVFEEFIVSLSEISNREYKKANNRNVVRNSCNKKKYAISIFIKFEGENVGRYYDVNFDSARRNDYTFTLLLHNDLIGLNESKKLYLWFYYNEYGEIHNSIIVTWDINAIESRHITLI